MITKKVLFVFVIIQAISVVFGLFGYPGLGALPVLERQTFILLVNAKEILLVALYIAWRVTP